MSKRTSTSSFYSSDSTDSFMVISPKKVHTPLKCNFNNKFTPLVEFINQEIEFYKSISLVITIYKALLAYNYNNLFTISEENLVFEDIRRLSECCKQFIVDIFVKLGNIKSDAFDFDVATMVEQNQGDLNIGNIINDKLFGNKKYKESMCNLKAKYDFIIDLIDQKSKFMPPVMKWLAESKKMTYNNMSLEKLLLKPLERLRSYPHQLKRIKDIDNNFDLNVSLIRVNKLIDQVWEMPSIVSWEQLRDFNNVKNHGEYDNNLEFRIEAENEFKLETLKSIKPLVGDKETPEVKEFLGKYYKLSKVHKTIDSYCRKVSKFGQSQVKFSKIWLTMFDKDPMMVLVFDKYMEKMNNLVIIIENFTFKVTNEVINRLAWGLQILHRVKETVKNKPVDNIKKITKLMDKLVYLCTIRFNDLNRMWLKTFIGEDKIAEFQQLRQQRCGNDDIVEFYNYLLTL